MTPRTAKRNIRWLLALYALPLFLSLGCTFVYVPRGEGAAPVNVVILDDGSLSPATATAISAIGVAAFGIPVP